MLDQQDNQPPLFTRVDAAMRGLTRFYTGKPCKNGHIAERYVSNRHCISCNATKARERERQRSRHDPAYRLHRNVQRRSGQALKGSSSPVKALGCSVRKLKSHIENQFTKGMSWAKYGQWEVDHITPLSAARNEHEAAMLCSYMNLQPLWKRDNQIKGGA